jgi:hypothetical protein
MTKAARLGSLLVEYRAVGNRRSAECPHCHETANLPDDEPVAIVDGKALTPHCLVQFRCPHCVSPIALDVPDSQGLQAVDVEGSMEALREALANPDDRLNAHGKS